MLGSDMLEIYLKYFHGSKNNIQFEANTLGSIYQLGVDTAATKWNEKNNYQQYINAFRYSVELPNGWTISGEMDQIDTVNKVIFDNKVTTSTAIIGVRKEGKNNSYTLQQGVYKWLLHEYAKRELQKQKPEIYEAVLPMVDKNFSYFKDNKFNQLNFEILETHTLEDIELLLLEKTNELQTYIDLGQEPDQCRNLYWFGKRGQKKKPMKCIFYCDQNSHCSHYSERNAMKNMLGNL
jgi:hypothetical protein